MRVLLWAVFFVISNIVGVEVFRAALTSPPAEALLPGALSVPLIGLAAFGASRLLAAWEERREE
jgi:hypothetical protein